MNSFNLDIKIAECKNTNYPSTSSASCGTCSGFVESPSNNCVIDCDDTIASKIITTTPNTCNYCALLSPSKYLYNNQCIDTKPTNTYISNETIGIICSTTKFIKEQYGVYIFKVENKKRLNGIYKDYTKADYGCSIAYNNPIIETKS